MQKIIIFGATGETGPYVADYAKKYLKNFEIIAVGRKKTDFFEKRGIKYHCVDIANADDFKVLPNKDIYAAMLIAAVIPRGMQKYDPKAYIDSNIIGAFNVLEYLRKTGADRIIYTQTSYDVWLSWRYSQEPVKFDAPLSFSYSGDHAFYVISKNTAVEMIKHYFEEYGLKYFIFRLPTIYAYNSNHYYYPNGIKTMRPIYQMIFKAVNGEGLEIWGDPKFSKDMTYVDDFAQMLCKAILVNRDNGFYNVGTGIPVTLEEQIRTIADVFSPKNKLPSIEYKPDKISGGGYLSDVSNAIKELNYKPEYDVRALFEAYKREMNLNTYNDLRK